MRCNVFYVEFGPDNEGPCTETLANVRDIDEIAQDNDWTDDEADAIEAEILSKGEFRIGGGAAPLFVIRRAS